MEELKSFLIIGFIRALGWLPLSAAQACGRALGRLFWATDTRMARTSRKNIALCFPDWSPADQEALARASLIHTAQAMMETGIAWMWPEERSRALIRNVINGELLDRCMADQKGLVIMMPHQGNWEMINQYFCQRYHGHAIYKPPKMKRLDRFICERREQFGHGIDMYPTTRAGVEALFDQVRSGGCAFVLPDQEPSLKSGTFAPFFGIPALTSVLIPRMVRETGCAVICCSVIRLPSAQGFEVRFREPEPGWDSPDELTAITALNQTVEACIAEAPEQYQWEYKRFKRRPDGAPSVY